MVWVGTSGYQFPEWKGSFYPEDLPDARMLAYYAERFPTVEVNYSFYRMPSEKTLQTWSAETPERFRFTLKASRRLTHDARLKECGEFLEVFCRRALLLGPKLATVFFQLPGNFKKKTDLLDTFLSAVPREVRAAFEFRSDTWFCDEVYEVLRAHNAALCVADSEKLSTPVVRTADFGYFRLRDEGYGEADLERWAAIIGPAAADGGDVYVYFKHEEQGMGAEFGRRLLGLLTP
jgi:uncharacterized protein YecE (DUF72 family)